MKNGKLWFDRNKGLSDIQAIESPMHRQGRHSEIEASVSVIMIKEG